jgi:23S rRNA (adenine2503-C2)-methyltransferase
MTKKALLGKTLTELKEIAKELDFPVFTARQIADWLYKKNIRSIEEMTNLSKNAREKLNLKYEIGLIDSTKVQVSVDGTKNIFFPRFIPENSLRQPSFPTKRETPCAYHPR